MSFDSLLSRRRDFVLFRSQHKVYAVNDEHSTISLLSDSSDNEEFGWNKREASSNAVVSIKRYCTLVLGFPALTKEVMGLSQAC